MSVEDDAVTGAAEHATEATTVAGIGYTMVAFAHDDVKQAATLIQCGDTGKACEKITTAIRQLEAARRMIA